ncbi:DUF4915 domain-containing protein [Paenibacillus allorhizoplanae]|uniref:DUF4915 domain-containing protein n=1 Tax=Paenibacillus allorhizoplanae TaxID=2905648 RepID=UPI001F1DE2A5|nr:DUF4915 domain-containing protein [Paenibacillus allorhizoplanae]
MDPFIRFQGINTKLLVSCPKDPSSPGGLFIIDFELKNITRILEADCRGITQFSEGYYLATNSHGILKLDNELNITNTYEVPARDLHGLKFHSDGLLYVVETSHNAIGIYQTEPFKRIDEIKISDSNEDQNHINDLCIKGNSLFLSMFSLQGGWRDLLESFDGVIAEYDIQTKELITILQKDLQLPHSVTFIDNQMYYCESLNLNLKKENQCIAKLGGYTRGLASDGLHFYVGQSVMRHLDRILSTIPNVSVDCGIHIFDGKKRVNKFFPMPANQIYEILIISNYQEEFIHPTQSSLEMASPESLQYLISSKDWHEPEGSYRWMASKRAGVKLRSENPIKTITIEFTNCSLNNNNAKLFVNNIEISSILFNEMDEQIHTFTLDEYFTGDIYVSLEVDTLWNPQQLIGNDDVRQLGLAVKSIKVLA